MSRRHLHAVNGRATRMTPGLRDQIMGAARQFLEELINTDYGGHPILFKHILRSYGQLAPDYGWPPVTDKTLSQCLCALGCARIKVDRRKTSGERLTYLAIPVSLAAPVEFELRRAA